MDDKQPLYGFIYILNLVKLKNLKIYIKIYLKTWFIQSLKSLISAFIFFNKKFNNNLLLYINYQDLNNLTIKNWYSLSFIDKLLD